VTAKEDYQNNPFYLFLKIFLTPNLRQVIKINLQTDFRTIIDVFIRIAVFTLFVIGMNYENSIQDFERNQTNKMLR
jgi:hypothetical protein